MFEDVIFSEENKLGIITLNRPKALNALTLEMVQAISERLNLWMHQECILAVIIRAVPGKVFCAGGDIRWLYEQGLKKDPKQLDFFSHEYALNKLVYHYPKPYIALIDGLNFGGGIGITLHGRYKVATEQSIFAMPETAIGFFPDVGASYILSRLGAIGMYLGLVGAKINANQAKNLGLIDRVIDNSRRDLLELVQCSIQEIPLLRSTQTRDDVFIPHQEEIETCFSSPSVPTIIENLKNHQSEWSQQVLAELLLKSPLSLMITFEQLMRAKSLSLDECLNMDAVLVKHFMQANDFYEGVRAMIIDKDKIPRWEPDSLEKITPEMVEHYFK